MNTLLKGKHFGGFWGFHRSSKAYYYKEGNKVSISIGVYHPDGGTTGEFQIVWSMLDGEAVPRLQAYDDSWGVLFLAQELLKSMASLDDLNVSESDFTLLLIELGFKDLTSVNPY